MSLRRTMLSLLISISLPILQVRTSFIMSLDDSQIQDGKIPFKIPSLEASCFTYYKIVGDLSRSVQQPPLVVLHGGPGSGHEYVFTYAKLWPLYGIPVIFYDQIGCAGSTHLQNLAGDKTFWQKELFISQLDNVLDSLHLRENGGPGFDLLGHSWGGMLSAAFASRRPYGLRRLILANAPASIPLFLEAQAQLRERLPLEMQQAINEAVRKEDFTDTAFINANNYWRETFWCRAVQTPHEIEQLDKNELEDHTVMGTMYGPSFFLVNGSLRWWTCIPRLHNINVPTLTYNGELDTAQDCSVLPFFNNIPKVRWVSLPGASHMSHLDNEEMLQRVLKLVFDFIRPDESVET